jgi:hypothetical protein
MQSFEWIDATSVNEAAELLAAADGNRSVVAKAGGMDLLDLMKEGILNPARVVNLKSIPGLDHMDFSRSGGLTLGALVTVAQIASASDIRQNYPALAAEAICCSVPAAGIFATSTFIIPTALLPTMPAKAKTNTTPFLTMADPQWYTLPPRQRHYAPMTGAWS